jgi:hypothetical protein
MFKRKHGDRGQEHQSRKRDDVGQLPEHW